MPTAIIGYNLLLVSALLITGLITAESNGQRLIALAFVPMVIYFIRQLKLKFSQTKPAPNAALTSTKAKPSSITTSNGTIIEAQELTDAEVKDINKRLFLKLIGSAGLATFVFAMFTKRAQASFFGSMPVPGSVTLKDSAGNSIDPAEKEPTDGYEINDVDDASIPSYYGFVDKDGNWYITKEDTDGSFRYARGSVDYSTNWTNRASLTYDYFNNVF